MKDRITQYPHRYQLVPVSGQSDTYDIIAKPGTVTEPGTPLNKANLLSDATANLYGLTEADATVDKALGFLIAKTIKTTGNVTFSDSIAKGDTLTKKIAVGAGKTFGRCVVSSTGASSGAYGIMVEFSKNIEDGLAVGHHMQGDSGSAISQRDMGYITSPLTGQFGTYTAGIIVGMNIISIHINGNDIDVVFKNVANTGSLQCKVSWEVW